MLLGSLICRWKGHIWRKAHKDEKAHSKYCRRCGIERVVSTRKPALKVAS